MNLSQSRDFLLELKLWSRLRLERVRKGSGEASFFHGVVFLYSI